MIPFHAVKFSCSFMHVKLRQTPQDVARLLRKEMTAMFKNRPEQVHVLLLQSSDFDRDLQESSWQVYVQYVTSIRDFDRELPASTTLYGAFRRRKNDDELKVVPHSFTYVRRERALAEILLASQAYLNFLPCLWT